MIEGLKVTVKGAELRDLCLARVQHHVERAKVYEQQVANMTKNDIEPAAFTGGDPTRALKEKQSSHEAQAGEIEFIANHLVLTEDYLLDTNALVTLGISKRHW